jgi:hypothetical protein
VNDYRSTHISLSLDSSTMKLCNTKYIVLGRGGHNQHNVFIQEYLDKRDELRQRCVLAKTRKMKRLIQEELIGWVHRKKGRFVTKCKYKRGTYRIISRDDTLKKVAQALRENRKMKSVSSKPIFDFTPEHYNCFDTVISELASNKVEDPHDENGGIEDGIINHSTALRDVDRHEWINDVNSFLNHFDVFSSRDGMLHTQDKSN